MANSLLSISSITATVLEILWNNLSLSGSVKRAYDTSFLSPCQLTESEQLQVDALMATRASLIERLETIDGTAAWRREQMQGMFNATSSASNSSQDWATAEYLRMYESQLENIALTPQPFWIFAANQVNQQTLDAWKMANTPPADLPYTTGSGGGLPSFFPTPLFGAGPGVY